jgi:hypothetical protein
MACITDNTPVLQVLDLEERLRAAVKEAEEINAQEKMFGWAQSKWVLVEIALLRECSSLLGGVVCQRQLFVPLAGIPASQQVTLNTQDMAISRKTLCFTDCHAYGIVLLPQVWPHLQAAVYLGAVCAAVDHHQLLLQQVWHLDERALLQAQS